MTKTIKNIKIVRFPYLKLLLLGIIAVLGCYFAALFMLSFVFLNFASIIAASSAISTFLVPAYIIGFALVLVIVLRNITLRKLDSWGVTVAGVVATSGSATIVFSSIIIYYLILAQTNFQFERINTYDYALFTLPIHAYFIISVLSFLFFAFLFDRISRYLELKTRLVSTFLSILLITPLAFFALYLHVERPYQNLYSVSVESIKDTSLADWALFPREFSESSKFSCDTLNDLSILYKCKYISKEISKSLSEIGLRHSGNVHIKFVPITLYEFTVTKHNATPNNTREICKTYNYKCRSLPPQYSSDIQFYLSSENNVPELVLIRSYERSFVQVNIPLLHYSDEPSTDIIIKEEDAFLFATEYIGQFEPVDTIE
jgi:hypothetical protein